MTECIDCGQTFEEGELNMVADGSVCDLCLVDRETAPTGWSWGGTVGAGICAVLASGISMRSTSSSSFSGGGISEQTVHRGLDAPGLALSSLAVGLALYNLPAALKGRRYLALVLLVGILLGSVWRFWDALPSTVTISS